MLFEKLLMNEPQWYEISKTHMSVERRLINMFRYFLDKFHILTSCGSVLFLIVRPPI